MTKKHSFHLMWQDVDDDPFTNKCRNAIVLTRVELSSKDGSTPVKNFAITDIDGMVASFLVMNPKLFSGW